MIKKVDLTHFNRFFQLLCVMASLLMTVVSCGSGNPVSRDSPKALAISSINPTKGLIGSNVTIKGSHFSSVESENVVKSGPIKASIESAKKTKLVVTVPTELKHGGIYQVTVSVKGKMAEAPLKFKVGIPPDTAVAPPVDGVLETVTWNVEFFGYSKSGPSNESLQTDNIIKVVDTLDADLYAFQEVQNEQALKKLTSRMKGYRGIFVDTHNQGNGLIYNTNTIDPISSGLIRENKFLDAWAGRKPFYFTFNYHPRKRANPIKIYAVVIHADAGASKADYGDRVKGAKKLYYYLSTQKRHAKIILLGDFNDELTSSIYENKPSPYKIFIQHDALYSFPTLVLSKHGETSEVNYQSVIDNIIISNEMDKYYKPGNTHVFIQVKYFIQNYGRTTSDHYPVEALFDMTPSK